MGQAEAKQLTLVYTARHHEDRDATNVIVGTFIIHSLPYFSLIDCGFTHSYVSSSVVGYLGIKVDDTSNKLFVISPLGQSIRVSKVYKRCSLEVQGYMFYTELMKLPFGEFDLILGMNWLVEHRVGLDCESKRVTFKVGNDLEIVMVGEH